MRRQAEGSKRAGMQPWPRAAAFTTRKVKGSGAAASSPWGSRPSTRLGPSSNVLTHALTLRLCIASLHNTCVYSQEAGSPFWMDSSCISPGPGRGTQEMCAEVN